MERLALISGLIGALITAALNFIIRRVLDARIQREAERKLAYVLLVRTGALLATETVIRAHFERLLTPVVRESFEVSNAQYDASHIVSAILASILKRGHPEDLTKNFRMVPQYVALLLEDARQSRLSPEQLSKLPRESIVVFDRFQAEHSLMCQVASLWCDYFEKGSVFWATPEVIHGQWRSLQRFMKNAREVRAILVEHGAATSIEADKLLASQISTLKFGVIAGLSDKPKLTAAASLLTPGPRPDNAAGGVDVVGGSDISG